MAGTNRTREGVSGGPAIILVRAQLGENIGAAARAMMNFGLTDLRLVGPRDGWPNPAAIPSASGADAILDSARVFEDTAAAVADLRHVYAITSRQRDLILPVVTPEGAGIELRRARDQGETSGLIFGGERAGLENADVVLAGKIVTIPANPAFASLNLAQAVLIMGYEWYRAGDPPPPPDMADMDLERRPATGQEISYFFEHIEAELDESGFLRPAQRRSAMIKNLRAMWQRFDLSDHDVRTLRGMIKSLSRKGDAKD